MQTDRSPAYDVYKPSSVINSKYYHYLFRTNIFNQECYKVGKGIMLTRWRTYSSQFTNIKVPIPSFFEQEQIIRYLDWKTSIINKLIANKKKQIELLKEAKQSIINQIVTKGLDLDAPLENRKSPVTNSIPRHWTKERLKHLLYITDEKIYYSFQSYIGLENIESFTGKYIITNLKPDGLCCKFSKGDILFSKLRPYLAKCMIAQFDGVGSTELLVLNSFSKCNQYFKYLLLSPRILDLINSSTYGAKMPRTNWDFISNIEVVVPPESEQRKIVGYLDSKLYKIDSSIEKLRAFIKNAEECKISLISDAVTGKIDVRDVKIPDYEYIEDNITNNNDPDIDEADTCGDK